MYQVLIVEDDPMVAAIDRQYTEAVGDFHVAAWARSGQEALDFFRMGDVDLVILDYYMPGMNGDVFLDRLHATGKLPAVIMVTSANHPEIVRGLIRRGVCDYLVKPFEYERFRSALERFVKTKDLTSSADSLGQKEIDRLFTGAEGSNMMIPLPKGLNEITLKRVRDKLREIPKKEFTSEEAAEAAGLSRITVRRYVSYLSECGELGNRVDYRTGGRPGVLYFWRN